MQWSLVALQAKLEVSNPTLAHLVLLYCQVPTILQTTTSSKCQSIVSVCLVVCFISASMASKAPNHHSELSNAILQHVELGAYPEPDVASADIPNNALPAILDAIDKTREGVKVTKKYLCLSTFPMLTLSLGRPPQPQSPFRLRSRWVDLPGQTITDRYRKVQGDG